MYKIDCEGKLLVCYFFNIYENRANKKYRKEMSAEV